jgi:ribosomal small subunit protein bTHX
MNSATGSLKARTCEALTKENTVERTRGNYFRLFEISTDLTTNHSIARRFAMGRGDRRTRRGKIFKGSNGIARPRKQKMRKKKLAGE